MNRFNGTPEEFVSKITHSNVGYLKKINGRLLVGIWWEEKDPSEYHFMNIAEKKINEKDFKSSDWIRKTDILWNVGVYLKEGYQMYFE